ncbi:hypothetical protein Lalb_Chr19g0129071 [Lupinus albus]|uniref:Uncharacterized protein n=1 Tax=Lupinus albus TaxID=3870 RepID=A0A6A4NFG6_LUPAL|nr:hypothetical protein Lalb_Chr19g0129071 [Lupinus albus]
MNNMKEVIEHNWLSAYVISVYMRYLYEIFINDQKSMIFLASQRMSF